LLTNFQDKTKANGVFNNIPLVTFGAIKTEWADVITANAAVTTANGYFTNGIDKGDLSADGVTGDTSPIPSPPVTDGDKLGAAYKTVKDYTGLADGGYTKAVAAKAGATTAQAAATTAVTPLATALTTAQKAYDDANKVNADYTKTKTDLNNILTKVKLLLDNPATPGTIEGLNAELIAARKAVDDAEKALDTAEKALANLMQEEDRVDAEIAYEQARLADLQEQWAARNAEAIEWLGLLNEALGN